PGWCHQCLPAGDLELTLYPHIVLDSIAARRVRDVMEEFPIRRYRTGRDKGFALWTHCVHRSPTIAPPAMLAPRPVGFDRLGFDAAVVIEGEPVILFRVDAALPYRAVIPVLCRLQLGFDGAPHLRLLGPADRPLASLLRDLYQHGCIMN